MTARVRTRSCRWTGPSRPHGSLAPRCAPGRGGSRSRSRSGLLSAARACGRSCCSRRALDCEMAARGDQGGLGARHQQCETPGLPAAPARHHVRLRAAPPCKLQLQPRPRSGSGLVRVGENLLPRSRRGARLLRSWLLSSWARRLHSRGKPACPANERRSSAYGWLRSSSQLLRGSAALASNIDAMGNACCC